MTLNVKKILNHKYAMYNYYKNFLTSNSVVKKSILSQINLKEITMLILAFLSFWKLNPKHARVNMIASRPKAR